MFDAVLASFLGGLLAYALLSGFQELRVWRLAKAVKDLQAAMLSDVRRGAAKKRWETNEELEVLERAMKTNALGVNTVPDKWGDMLNPRS